MKKILIALALLVSVQVVNAQVKSVDAVKKAVETAEADAQNPKKNTKVATWLKLATVYMDAYEAPAGNVLVNSPRAQVQIMLGNEKPSSSEVVTVDGLNFKKEVYSNKNLYFDETDVLRIIEITKPVYEDALAKALNAYPTPSKSGATSGSSTTDLTSHPRPRRTTDSSSSGSVCTLPKEGSWISNPSTSKISFNANVRAAIPILILQAAEVSSI